MNSFLDIFDPVHSLHNIHVFIAAEFKILKKKKNWKGPSKTPYFHTIFACHLVNDVHIKLCVIIKSNDFCNMFIIVFYLYTCMFGA